MVDIEATVQAMTLEEKAALTAGEDMFSTVGLQRLGVPKVRVTDGPSGARGDSFPGIGGHPSTCIPCGSAIGASWDVELAGALGAVVAREALARGCRGLLAPTVNLHRSPLAGRNFECYSEDPYLSGKLGASYIRRVQALGVFATVKHLVGNDAEFERNSIDSVIDERALRELYLLPFEMAVREGGVLGVMTAYNRMNGQWLTEQRRYLTDILREEWGFEGLVMSDWFAVVNPTESLAAGLDLEMPGPGRSLGARVAESVRTGAVDEKDVDGAVGHLLGVFDRLGVLDLPTPAVAPGPPATEDLELLRRAATDCSVLLTNDGVLPLDPATLGRLAVIGPLVLRPTIVGGGSAGVRPHRAVDFLGSVAAAVGDSVELLYERGCEIEYSATVIGRQVLRAPDGFTADVFSGLDFEGPPVHTHPVEELRVFAFGSMTPKYPSGSWSMRVSGTIVSDEEGRFQLALAQSGRARVYLDGELVMDGFTNPPPPGGTDFFGQASLDLTAEVALARGRPHSVVVEYSTAGAVLTGFRVGFRTVDTDPLLDRAVTAAAESDAALVFVGHTHEWETEGRDRRSFHLPGRQDELVRRVAAANRRTIVVVNAGAAVDLPWTGEVGAVLQCWFAGQEMDNGVADILVGRSEPGGRLPVTIPERIEHNPSHDNFPGENGRLRYGEGVFSGYRGYDHRKINPRFAFGHGLGYTTFELGEPSPASAEFQRGGQLSITVPVTNTGDRAGSEVIQCYVAPPPNTRLARPPRELKAFAKVHLAPGESTDAELILDGRSFSYWDPGQPDFEQVRARLPIPLLPGQAPGSEPRPAGWQIDPGRYEVLIGRSAADIRHRVPVKIGDDADPPA